MRRTDAGGADGKGGGAAAAHGEDRGRCDKKDHSKGQIGRKLQLVGDLLAVDCQKAWFHSGWEDAMLQWYKWLHEMK